MYKMIQGQIQDKTVLISHSTNAFEKGMNPTILLPVMGKVRQTGLFDLVMATSLEERKLWIQTR